MNYVFFTMDPDLNGARCGPGCRSKSEDPKHCALDGMKYVSLCAYKPDHKSGSGSRRHRIMRILATPDPGVTHRYYSMLKSCFITFVIFLRNITICYLMVSFIFILFTFLYF